MKKLTLILITLFLCTFGLSQIASAQTLPAKARNYLKANYPGWEITKGCFSDAELKSKSFVSGDFNGDRRTDHAVAINKGGRSYTLVLIATVKSYKAVNLKAVDLGDNTPLANLGIMKKGELVSGSRDGNNVKFRLKTDAVVVAECDAYSQVFYWANGQFLSLELP